MTAATQGFVSPTGYGPANMFAPSGRNMTKSSDFMKTFGNTATNIRTVEPQQMEKYTPRGVDPGSINTDEASFFDFEPSSNTASPFQNQFSTPGNQGLPSWSNDMNLHPLSPPDSASFSPKDWQYGYQNRTPSNIHTNIQPNSRVQYGQVTPPDDEIGNDSMLELKLEGDYRQRQMSPPDTSGGRKRKRNALTAGDSNDKPSKRNRRYASRGSNTTADTDKKQVDVKRSKFLERNRVAASKCRQKKKEWTQDLENRARELQKNNNSLRMMIESCRQEILFLKGELLKHDSCDCTHIQDFLKNGADSLPDLRDEDAVKRKISSFESMPVSRIDSISDGSSPGDRNADNSSPMDAHSRSAIVDDDVALEALLSSSINNETSDEAVASQVKS